MKFSETWLREHINPALDTNALAEQMTQAGLQVDSVQAVAADFSNILVGQVLSVERHPDADKLSVCKVTVGDEEPLQIVCGASNVRPEMKVPTAIVGAKIGKDFKIKKSKLRGVQSCGMLCSATELGLAETANGIYELPQDAPVGQDVREYLQLDDTMIDVELTPNRGDCLSIVGLARDVAVLNNLEYQPPIIRSIPASIDDKPSIQLHAPEHCARYVGRIIRGICLDATTPLWLQERLRRSGIRSIDPVVDVTNYVMLELGQPMHAFDLKMIDKGIHVRLAAQKETLTLLDDTELTLSSEDLVIADDKKALALAGVMGGLHSGVNSDTQDILLESAYFAAEPLALTARRYGLHTDSSHRYERGVDFSLQAKAMERATELLLDIVGGQAGSVTETLEPDALPSLPNINVRHSRIERVLGYEVETANVVRILQQLGMKVAEEAPQWSVIPPSYRYDIRLEVDCVEEVGRVIGYDQIPYGQGLLDAQLKPVPEENIAHSSIRQLLVDRDYMEAITYSFVNNAIQQVIAPDVTAIQLLNPISQDMSVMRTSMWPGLIQAMLYNLNRQQSRIRLFELGLCFSQTKEGIQQVPNIGGLCLGPKLDEQWASKASPVDFYDIKSDVQALLVMTGFAQSQFQWQATKHTALHPGQGADVLKEGKIIGHVGALHPAIKQKLGIKANLWLFELNLQAIDNAQLPKFATLSKYPAIRRDIAVVIDEKLTAAELELIVQQEASELLVDLTLFDVYHGENLPKGQKSIALGMLLQHSERTLQDGEVNDLMDRVVNKLQQEMGAVLRE